MRNNKKTRRVELGTKESWRILRKKEKGEKRGDEERKAKAPRKDTEKKESEEKE